MVSWRPSGTTYDYLIVGAGLTGATCARMLTDCGKRVLVIEKRDHIGGNCFDELFEGIPVNRYGGHIFHTNSDRIWNFAKRFSDWLPYEHRVKAYSAGVVYSLPPNLMTFQQLGIPVEQARLPEALELVRMKFFYGYSIKHWGRPYREIPESIIKRIPVRYNWDDRYFDDKYQGLPAYGYAAWIGNILHGIDVQLEADYLNDDGYWNRMAAKVIYTGQIDRYYHYDLGMLEYRSLRFEHDTVCGGDLIGCATMNFSDIDVPHTRIMEWKYFGYRGGSNGPVTTEYPEDYTGANEPYYPVPDEKNKALYQQYRERMSAAPWLIPAGRLGAYQYYNMDQAIGASMALVERLAHG